MTYETWWEQFSSEHDEWRYADSKALRQQLATALAACKVKDAAAGSYDETANRREIYSRWDEIHGECVYAVLDAVDYVLRTRKDDEE